MMEKIDFTQELVRAMGTVSHQGCLIEARGDGYYVGKVNTGTSLAGAKTFIEDRFRSLSASFSAAVNTAARHFNKKGMIEAAPGDAAWRQELTMSVAQMLRCTWADAVSLIESLPLIVSIAADLRETPCEAAARIIKSVTETA